MEAAMKDEVAKIVANLAPPQGALGLLTANDVRQIIERAAAQGVLAGWTAGMRQARSILADTLEMP
jgi:AmiR/NasT family two-component response regulator